MGSTPSKANIAAAERLLKMAVLRAREDIAAGAATALVETRLLAAARSAAMLLGEPDE